MQAHDLSSERKGVSVWRKQAKEGAVVQGKQEGFTLTGAAFVLRVRRDHKEEGGVIISALQAQE